MASILWFENGITRQSSLEELLSYPQCEVPRKAFVWVDLATPTLEEEITVLKQWVGVHDLVLADMRMASMPDSDEPHPPGIEEFPDHLFVILQSSIMVPRKQGETVAEHLSRVKKGQLNLILTDRVIITHHPLIQPVVANVMKSVDKNHRLFERGPDFLLALILDEIIQDTGELLELIDERAAELEQRMLRTESMVITSRLLGLKRIVHDIRRVLARQDEMVYRLSRGEFKLVNKDEAVYYRDVHDHHVMALDHVDSLRDSLTGLMEVYFSLSSSRLNQVMRILTVISTIFLPITFITSLYGMNFHFMPELGWQWGYPLVIFIILVVSGTMLMLFKRRGWLG